MTLDAVTARTGVAQAVTAPVTAAQASTLSGVAHEAMAQTIVPAVATACLVALVACLVPCVYRLAAGPHALDRLLAFDLTGVLISAIVAVFAIVQRSPGYLEISMGLAVLSFVGTIAAAHYFEREGVP